MTDSCGFSDMRHSGVPFCRVTAVTKTICSYFLPKHTLGSTGYYSSVLSQLKKFHTCRLQKFGYENEVCTCISICMDETFPNCPEVTLRMLFPDSLALMCSMAQIEVLQHS